MPTPHIAIIGAGPAGMIAAITAHRLGMDVAVYEQAPRLDCIGGGILLHRNGLRVLHALGLQKEFLPQTRIIHGIRLESETGGVLLDNHYPALAPPPHDFGAVLLRYTLQNFLVAVAEREGIPIYLGHTLHDIAIEGPRSVRLKFAEREDSHPADAVIACDGVHSRIRQRLFPNARFWMDTESWMRGVTPLAMATPMVREIWAKDGRTFGLMPLRDGQTHFFCSVPSREEWHAIHADPERRRAWIEGWYGIGDDVVEMLKAVPELDSASHNAPGYVILPRWHHGPILFAGDSAHAMPPNLGQGANAAMVDALIAARLLVKAFDTDGDLEAAGRAYQSIRQPFVQRTQTAALQMNRLARCRAPLPRQGRDMGLRTIGRIAPLLRIGVRLTIGDNAMEERYLTRS